MKSIGIAGLLPGLLLIFSPALAGNASPEPAQNPTPAVKTFQVAPSQRPAAIMAPNLRLPAAPAPLDTDFRSRLLSGLGAADPAAPESFTLDAKTPYIEGRGFLRMSFPRTFHPEAPIVFDKEFPGRVSVHLMVEAGASYLVDFSVAAQEAGSYTVMADSGEQEITDADGHLLLALQAEASGWTSLRLSRAGGSFSLYSVEITRIR
jgi:hypothetical protein